MFFPNLITIIPEVVNLSKDVPKLFDGTATEEEWNAVLGDIERLVNGIPEAKAFAVLVSATINVLKIAIPMLDPKARGRTQGMVSLASFDALAPTDDFRLVSDAELMQAKASLRILEAISDKIAEQERQVASKQRDIFKEVFGDGRSDR